MFHCLQRLYSANTKLSLMETRQPEVVIDSARIGCLFQGFVDPYKLHITIMFVSDVFVNVMPAECHFCKQTKTLKIVR